MEGLLMDLATDKERPGQVQQGAIIKRRGRPRLATFDGDPTEQRRAQIRDAQQTFRLKKDSLARRLQKRVDELEAEARRMEELFSTLYDTATRLGIHRTEPELALLLDDIAPQFLSENAKSRRSECRRSTPEKAGPDLNQVSDEPPRVSLEVLSPAHHHAIISGYQAPRQCFGEAADSTFIEENSRLRMSGWSPLGCDGPVILLKEMQLNKTDYTYSFQEVSFSRRLHRYCLEHTYRLFTHPATDPRTIYRVFRLVSCIADPSKMRPYFERLLQRGPGESLEILSLPFYTIGRAGTHYPRNDSSGNPSFPVNMRLPKRILGSLPFSGTGMLDQEQSYQNFLDMMGYGGVWLDSYDVESYLKDKGVILENFSSFVDVQATIEHSHLGPSSPVTATTFRCHTSDIADGIPISTTMHEVHILNTAETSDTNASSKEHLATQHAIHVPEQTGCSNSPSGVENQTKRVGLHTPLIFDVQRFLEYLLRDVVMLGRAPGFRKSQVDAAIDHSMRQIPL